MRPHRRKTAPAERSVFRILHNFFYIRRRIRHRQQKSVRTHIHKFGDVFSRTVRKPDDTFQSREPRRHDDFRNIRIIEASVFRIENKEVHSSLF